MDNSLYYYPAEIEYRRERATKALKRRKRRASLSARAPWHRRHGNDATS